MKRLPVLVAALATLCITGTEAWASADRPDSDAPCWLDATSCGIETADEADTCLRQKIQDGAKDGWTLQTATSTTLGTADYSIYLVTLHAGNEYRVLACGDHRAEFVDLTLHDSEGTVMAASSCTDGDECQGTQPVITYKPTTTGTFYVAVYATTVDRVKAQVDMAIVTTQRQQAGGLAEAPER